MSRWLCWEQKHGSEPFWEHFTSLSRLFFCRFPESGIHFGMVPGLLGGPEMTSPGTAKSCWKGKELVIEERRRQKVSKAASVQAEPAFFSLFFLLLLSSWDYSLCAKPTRDRRASEGEAQGGSGAAPFESFRSLLHLCVVAGVSRQLPPPSRKPCRSCTRPDQERVCSRLPEPQLQQK